ncbi:CU044_2847 family protein [Kitasatospora sp. NPDC088779]|uniref:CU044_2847 family protein n=1 Tax=unclassified Kitasatospora TaxID=2633591 RepID=UPI00344903BD
MGLSTVLGPVTATASTVLARLREAGPAEVEVGFGIDLATEAGVVISRAAADRHLTVRMVWCRGRQRPCGCRASAD